jgi:enoyl-CoA hydratase/carnithine racemase
LKKRSKKLLLLPARLGDRSATAIKSFLVLFFKKEHFFPRTETEMAISDKLQIAQPSPGIVVLTLNRPEVMNAIDMELFELLYSALDELERDDTARVIVLTGAGERAFSAGFDIHEMAAFDADAMATAFARRDKLFWRIANHRKPVLAALNGVAYGAGALMALAADFRMGSPTTRFKITATTYGAANATWSLPRIVGVSRAKEILFTGRAVDASEAQAIGLIDKLVTDHAVLAAALDMAAAMAANPPEGVQAVKALINASLGRSLEAAYQAEQDWVAARLGGLAKGGDAVFSGFLAKRRVGPDDEGA